ncbi:hypothetical protein QJQ45_013702 [Haematococcus lacustris]|nr:hypothetical protein QJQ45_013702 [Haematococcus lacustris]
MAKTDDNVKEFLEKMGGELLLNEYAATCDEVRARIYMAPYVSISCDAWSPSQGGEHILGWLGLLAAGQPGAGQGQLAAGQAGSFGCEEAANFSELAAGLAFSFFLLSELAAMSKLFNERVAYGETGALYATGLLDPWYRGRHTELTHSQVMMADMCIAELASADGQGMMWMSSYIYFNRRALKGTRGQTRSSEEERAEFEEWLQHQPNGISE